VPPAATVVVADLAPDNVTVAADPVTVPEMLYVVSVPVKLTWVTFALLTVTEVEAGENA